MKRYQVYLNPFTVGFFDELASHVDLSRSRLIQYIVGNAAENIKALFAARETQRKKRPIFESIIGSITTKHKVSYSTRHDSRYLKD